MEATRDPQDRRREHRRFARLSLAAWFLAPLQGPPTEEDLSAAFRAADSFLELALSQDAGGMMLCESASPTDFTHPDQAGDPDQAGEVREPSIYALRPQGMSDGDACRVPHEDFLGWVAYRTYGDAARWQNHRGEAMPTWLDLPESIRGYWRLVAAEVGANHDALKSLPPQEPTPATG